MRERPDPADPSGAAELEPIVVGAATEGSALAVEPAGLDPVGGDPVDVEAEGFVDRLRHAQTGTDNPNISGVLTPLDVVPIDAPAGPIDPERPYPDATGVDHVEI